MPRRSSRRTLRILIIDDDPDIQDSMCDALTSWHCDALAASSGPEALNILSRRHVDVAMPGMDGVDTLREIRQRLPALPVLMMSATMTSDLRRHLCDIGAQSCLAKPTNRKGLALALFPWYFPAAPTSGQGTDDSA